MYSSGSEPVTIFGAQSWLWGAQFSFGGTQAVIWGGTAPECSPRGTGPITAYLAIFLRFRTLNCGQVIDRQKIIV